MTERVRLPASPMLVSSQLERWQFVTLPHPPRKSPSGSLGFLRGRLARERTEVHSNLAVMGGNQVRDQVCVSRPVLVSEERKCGDQFVPEVRSLVTHVPLHGLGQGCVFGNRLSVQPSPHRVLEDFVCLAQVVPAGRAYEELLRSLVQSQRLTQPSGLADHVSQMVCETYRRAGFAPRIVVVPFCLLVQTGAGRYFRRLRRARDMPPITGEAEVLQIPSGPYVGQEGQARPWRITQGSPSGRMGSR